MERSPELEAVARQRAEAFNNRDAETALNLYADEPGSS
jgi:ketosteroid isomerase-like protein